MLRSHFIFIKSVSFVLLYLLILGGRANVFAGETVRINGSGTALEVMKPLIAAYAKSHPGVMLEMHKPLGSAGALKALKAGVIDIAVTSRPLKPGEAAWGLKFRAFGKTPLAIVTGKGVSQKNILTGELEAIYSGVTRKWANGEVIRVVLRPAEDIDTMTLRGLSPGMDKAMSEAQKRQGMIMAVTDPESNEMMLKTAGSIGASGLAGIIVDKLPLNILSLNGVMPTPMALAEGRYPIAKDIDFVTTDKLPDAAAKFLEFVYSEKGCAIVKKFGVLLKADRNAPK